ncbi:hypothetical protein JIG36_13280 [Actinoplanes sp. LDG1-06]|uniref:Uncharacterized protein n=1 Tax=Paractinoplanes ovalisporus TaxID=2810368 RepID=A0ABS2A9M0_9ACTN|nr:hypothetical protein [Actinoplanes ovalisporus]MBM2616530.1 hypothetical protein [Actinoplanes ovalisporus]
MLLVPLLIAPAVMVAVAFVERRLGPSAAGWTAALPVSLAVSVVAVAVDMTPQAAASLALSAATHVPAQVAFAVVSAHVLRRRGLTSGLNAGALAYVAGSFLPGPVALALAVVALVAGPRLMPTARPLRPAPRHWSSTVLTCLSATAMVGTVMLCARLADPIFAGGVAAFPTMCATVTVVAVTRDGPAAGAQTLTGLVRSLPCYLAFCLVVALSAPLTGVASAGLGLLAALGAAAVTWRFVPKAAPAPFVSHAEALG